MDIAKFYCRYPYKRVLMAQEYVSLAHKDAYPCAISIRILVV